MIVRNEEHVVVRALRSVKRLVDYWIVCDTGSNDWTPIEVMNTMAGVPGELHRRQWVDFGHNRTEAVRLARTKADYVLILDADMVANIHGPFKDKLAADAYEIRYDGDVDYSQQMLIASRHDWTFIGTTHEYIYSPTAVTREWLPELTLKHYADGGMRGNKFVRDIALLEKANREDPENTRTAFYLAQSYADSGRLLEALSWYERRIAMGGWEEEQWYSMYRAARMRQLLGHDWDCVLRGYERAFEARPWRIEPLYQIVMHYRETEDYRTGFEYAARAGMHVPYPEDFVFIDKPVYQHLFPLEFGACAYGAGHISLALEAFDLALTNRPHAEWIVESATRGRTMALADLQQPA
jgi:glycosyltransferase involved in cell wall biosynthesis